MNDSPELQSRQQMTTTDQDASSTEGTAREYTSHSPPVNMLASADYERGSNNRRNMQYGLLTQQFQKAAGRKPKKLSKLLGSGGPSKYKLRTKLAQLGIYQEEDDVPDSKPVHTEADESKKVVEHPFINLKYGKKNR